MSKLVIDNTTIINAPGKGVTHSTSTLASGFTGAIHWTVFNGICIVSLAGVTPSSTGGGKTVYTSLPKCGQYAAVTTADNSNAFYINYNATTLLANINTLAAQTLQIVYPVASDWEES